MSLKSRLTEMVRNVFSSTETKRKAQLKSKLLQPKRSVFADKAKPITPWYSLKNDEIQIVFCFVICLIPFSDFIESAYWDAHYQIKLWLEKRKFRLELDESEKLANMVNQSKKNDS